MKKTDHPPTKPVTELVATLRALTPRCMAHAPIRRHWLTATHLISNATARLASEATFRHGQWTLMGHWREHEAAMAHALRDLAMARHIALGIRLNLPGDEDSHSFDCHHLERTIEAIDELQHHPRFSRLPSHTPATEIQPA